MFPPPPVHNPGLHGHVACLLEAGLVTVCLFVTVHGRRCYEADLFQSFSTDGDAKDFSSCTIDSGCTSISLYSNDDDDFADIGDVGAVAIANAIEHNHVIVDVSLHSVGVGDEGASAFARILETNDAIRELALTSNAIGDRAAFAIAEALKVNSRLEWLQLNDNVIGNEGAAAIAEALKVNTVIQSLFVDCENINDMSLFESIRASLDENQELGTRSAKAERIGAAAAAAAAAAEVISSQRDEL